MIDKKRRAFLTRSTALAASGALAACGGGGGGGQNTALAATVTPSPPGTPLPPDTGTPPAPNPPAVVNPDPGTPIAGASFTLFAPVAQALAPFSLGYAFKRGDVPAGKTVVADKGSLQVSAKNAWPDGSLKFAILSGLADVAGGAAGSLLGLRLAAPAAQGAALTTTQLRATGAVAEVGCGAFGTVRWQGADWDAPLRTWVSGALMSSWIYRKPVGSDPHLVAWLEVRLWSNGAVEILPWIENGYLRVAAPANKAATYTFTLGGSERMSAAIDLKHHQRSALINGSALSYWLGADPAVTPRHDPAYLQATELVPSYRARLDANAPNVKKMVTAYTPLQAGNLVYDGDNMASSGYQDPIGLLPLHDVIYLVSDAVNNFGAVVRNGLSAGRYSIHYRDETTLRPLRFSSYPTLNIGNNQGFKDNGGSTTGSYTPAPTGGSGPTWDVAHSPSVGYLAYLVTGRWYFMEEVQFATTANYLGNGDNAQLRTGSKGLVQTAAGAWQTRSCAWDWRARVQALCVTPDDDAELRAEFIASVEANIEHFHGRYVAQANNPFGWIKSAEVYDGTMRMGAPWQQDFVTAAFGLSVSLGLPISSTAAGKLAAFFQWKARSAIMRLGPKSAFWYVNAVPYVMPISPSNSPNYDTGAGPWYDNEAAVYAATYAVPQVWQGLTEGLLAGEIMPGERAMWGNLQPAIAYAVRHGVPGALDAYNRMTAASNWKALSDAFNVQPVWAVQPAGYVAPPAPPVVVTPPTQAGDPSWMAGKAIGEWFEIPGTGGAGGSAVHAYSGMAYNEATGDILIAGAGGHFDSADNRVVAMRLLDNAPAWRQLSASSSVQRQNVAYYDDGKPTSRHLYNSVHYIPQLNRIMLFGAYGAYGSAHSFNTVDGFDLSTNTWDPAGTHADIQDGQLGAVSVRATGEVFSTGLRRWSPLTRAWTAPITKRTQDLLRAPVTHDSLRNQLFSLQYGDDWGPFPTSLFASRIPLSGNEQFTVTFKPGVAVDTFNAEQPAYAGMDYDVVNDRFLFYCGREGAAGRVYAIKPNAGNVWDMSLLPLVGATRPPATPPAGVHSRFRYIPSLRGFLLMPDGKSNLYFLRTSA
jgi:hypothetical protein